MGYRLEPATLRHLWPKAPQAKIDAICSISEEVLDTEDPHVVVQFMANVSHECGAGTIVRESGNYTAIRIVQVFGKGKSSAAVSPEEAQELAHKPEALFDRVYNLPHSPKLAHELGNHLPGDGYKFRGGGDLQLTGAEAYQRIGKMTGHPEIFGDPNLLADPVISFKVAWAEFKALGCVSPARKSQTGLVRRKVNGGTNGLAEVQVWVRKWSEALPDVATPEPLPRGSDAENTKPIVDSSVIKGSIGAAVATGGGIVSSVSNVTQQASDTVVQVQGAAENVHSVVKAVHPFLGLMPQVWEGIGLACGGIALVALAYVVVTHWQDIRQGRLA